LPTVLALLSFYIIKSALATADYEGAVGVGDGRLTMVCELWTEEKQLPSRLFFLPVKRDGDPKALILKRAGETASVTADTRQAINMSDISLCRQKVYSA
jgi:hypothetical protein